MSPSLIIGDSFRPDFHLVRENNALYILELTLDFETNIQANSVRKAIKYTPLLPDLFSFYNRVILINVSKGTLCIIGSSCNSFLTLLKDLNFCKVTQRIISMKTMNIATRSAYPSFFRKRYIMKQPYTPDLLNIYFPFLPFHHSVMLYFQYYCYYFCFVNSLLLLLEIVHRAFTSALNLIHLH